MEVDNEEKQQEVKEKDLFKATEDGDTSALESVSSETLSKALITLRNEDGRTLLHVAASSGHSQVPFCPSSKGSLFFFFNCNKNTSFLHSPKLGFWWYNWEWVCQVVKLLASCDASARVVNSADEEGWAPLHSAASIGNLEIVETLLSKGQCFFDYYCF